MTDRTGMKYVISPHKQPIDSFFILKKKGGAASPTAVPQKKKGRS